MDLNDSQRKGPRRRIDLDGARVLLTGARGGIGTAATAELERRGARVVGIDLEPADGVIAADVRDGEAVVAAVTEAIDRLGGLDVLVNNAGIGNGHDSGEAPDAVALAILDINLLGTWRVTGAAMPALVASGGRVVNVASGLAFVNTPFSAAYCASKRGVAAYSDVLRLEYGDRVNVVTLCPGYIRTAIHDAPAEKGLSLDGMVPAEPVAGAARAIVRAASGRPKRLIPTSRATGAGMFLARHVPALVDRSVARRVRAQAARGRFDDSPLAARALGRVAE